MATINESTVPLQTKPKIVLKKFPRAEPVPLLMTGTSGFSYKWWFSKTNGSIGLTPEGKPILAGYYPSGINDSNALQYYAKDFSFIEINSTFYTLPSPKTVVSWYSATPPDFRFLLKFSRFGTHAKKLGDFEKTFTEFWVGRCDLLKEKCVGILIQLGPDFMLSDRKSPIDGLTMLQRITTAAAVTKKSLPPSVTVFVEFRNPTWFVPEVYTVLRDVGWSLVCVNLNNAVNAFGSMPSGFSPPISECPITVDNTLMFRCHGTSPQAYHGGYDETTLAQMASMSHGKLKFIVAFDNTDSMDGEMFTMPSMITKGKQTLIMDPDEIRGKTLLLPHAIRDSMTMKRILCPK